MAARACRERRVRTCHVAPAYGQVLVTPLWHTMPAAPGFRPVVPSRTRRAYDGEGQRGAA
jgi:hypothetical protein